MSPRIAYICDGAGTLGWGHVWRGTSVVDSSGSGSALVMAQGRAEVDAWFRSHGVTTALRAWESPSRPLDPRSSPFDVLVIDHYDLDPAWIADASESVPTYVVDDWMRTRLRATGLINPNVGAAPEHYPSVEVRQWLLGAPYVLVRDAVRQLARGQTIADAATGMLVTLGGSDPDGRVAEVVTDMTDLDWYRSGGRISVVLGASYRGPEPWADWPRERGSRVEVLRQPAEFLARCQVADVVVCGASTASNEMAYLGRPFVPVAFVDNQAMICRQWARHGIGPDVNVWNPGWRSILRDHVARLLASAGLRRVAAARGMALVDGCGPERLLAIWRTEIGAI